MSGMDSTNNVIGFSRCQQRCDYNNHHEFNIQKIKFILFLGE